MRMSRFRELLSGVLVWIVPVSLFAADTKAAMLYTNGTTWLNGSNVPKSSAIFRGDLVQTKADSVASINAPGASVIILSDSLVKYEGSALQVEHGGVTVSTSGNMTARAGEVTVAPASNAWTEFEVMDVDGAVQIAARKGDLTVSDQSGTATLSQGQQTSRDESEETKKKKKRRGGGAVPGAAGGLLDSPVAIGIGAAAVGGLVTWVLLQGDEPASPAKPN